MLRKIRRLMANSTPARRKIEAENERRIETEKGTKRITADFSPPAYAMLSKVAKRLDSNKAEALRRALGLMDIVQRRQAEGWKLVFEHETTKEREVIIFPPIPPAPGLLPPSINEE